MRATDIFLWYSGVAAWLTLAVFGLLAAADTLIDWMVNSLWTKREFLAFVWDRIKRRKKDAEHPITSQ